MKQHEHITLSTVTLYRRAVPATVALIAGADGSHGVRVTIGDDTHESPFPLAQSIAAGIHYDAAIGALWRLGWREQEGETNMSAIKCANCGGIGESSLAILYCAKCYSQMVLRALDAEAELVQTKRMLIRAGDWSPLLHLGGCTCDICENTREIKSFINDVAMSLTDIDRRAPYAPPAVAATHPLPEPNATLGARLCHVADLLVEQIVTRLPPSECDPVTGLRGLRKKDEDA